MPLIVRAVLRHLESALMAPCRHIGRTHTHARGFVLSHWSLNGLRGRVKEWPADSVEAFCAENCDRILFCPLCG